jgi:hypothetical protein
MDERISAIANDDTAGVGYIGYLRHGHGPWAEAARGDTIGACHRLLSLRALRDVWIGALTFYARGVDGSVSVPSEVDTDGDAEEASGENTFGTCDERRRRRPPPRPQRGVEKGRRRR